MELVNGRLGLSELIDGADEALEERASLDRFFADLGWMGVGLDRKRICINAAIGFGAHILLDSLVSKISVGRPQEAERTALRMLVYGYELISTIDELVLRELVHQGFGLEDPEGLSKRVVKHLLVGALFARFKGVTALFFGCALVVLRSLTGNQIAPTVLYVLHVVKGMKELGVLRKA